MSSNSIGSCLKSVSYWTSEDFLTSENGIYTAVLHGDGNICIYAGGNGSNHFWSSGTTGNAEKYVACLHSNGDLCIYPNGVAGDTWIWASHKSGKTGPDGVYYLNLNDDGSLCIYADKINGPLMWTSGVSNPVEEIIEIASIDYDVDHATIVPGTPDVLANGSHINNTDLEQSFTLEYAKTIEESVKWSIEAGIKCKVSTSLAVHYPLIADGKVTVSVEADISYSHEETVVETKTFKNTVPIKVPPHTKVDALIQINGTTINVPYKLTGKAKLKSGGIINNYFETGTYIGNNSHDIYVKVSQTNLNTNETTTVTHDLDEYKVNNN